MGWKEFFAGSTVVCGTRSNAVAPASQRKAKALECVLQRPVYLFLGRSRHVVIQ